MLTDDERSYMRWYDYLWLLIPIAGIVLMVDAAIQRERAAKGR